MTIKAIETVYRGWRFRSRLEARWAVFFDALGIAWEYEPEGYELSDGSYYLPDFWLPTFNRGMFVEVKPTEDSDFSKAHLLAKDLAARVWLAWGTPAVRSYVVVDGRVNAGCPMWDGLPNADQAEHENRMYAGPEYDPTTMPETEWRRWIGETLPAAVEAARSARFEHGENGALGVRA